MKEEIKRSSELSQYKTELKAQNAQIDKLDKRVMLMAEENTRIASKLNCNQTFGLVTFTPSSSPWSKEILQLLLIAFISLCLELATALRLLCPMLLSFLVH